MKLSVIIPTRNRAKLLNDTILSITKQTLSKDKFEVIVVDNGSSDNTKEIVETYIEILDIKYYYEPKPGLHEGRHTGLKLAKSELLVYADDDIEAFPKWLETIFQVFQNDEETVLVGGKNLPKYESNPPFWVLEKWNTPRAIGKVMGVLSLIDLGGNEKEISPYYVFGCNFSVRKKVVIDAGGFNPDGMPFDLIHFRGDGETHISDYIKEKNYKTYYHPNASVYHFVSNDRMTEDYFCKWQYTAAISQAFSDIRRNKITNFDYNLKLRSLRDIKSYLKNIILNLNKTDFQKRQELSFENGYKFLLNQYKTNEEVEKWILKEKFL